MATENRDRITIRAMEKDRFERWRLDCGVKPCLGSDPRMVEGVHGPTRPIP